MPLIVYLGAVLLTVWCVIVMVDNQRAAPSRFRYWAKTLVIAVAVVLIVHAALVRADVL